MACEEIVIPEIDQMLYEKLLAEATSAGAKFSGSSATLGDIELDWNYDIASRNLHVTCQKKPFFITCLAVESRIRQLVDKAKVAI